MKHNLLSEPWLPAMFPDGETRWIRPSEMTGEEAPPVMLNPKRPDFKAALMEFLVGLVQTSFAPKDKREWRERLQSPPTQEELQAAFAGHEEFFNLFGERPRFMQDLAMGDKDKPIENEVVSLFIEQPTGIAFKKNTDHFIKRGQVSSLCPACAAAALYTLQTFSPSGGRGNRTSMRGGGPLSTLVAGKTLWESVWLNVLPVSHSAFPMPVAGSKELRELVYPWMSPTRTSDKGEQVHPTDMHPLHAFWGMPRRVVLSETTAQSPCDVCGREHELAVTSFLSRPNGYNYGSYWLHPLTPYVIEQGKEPLSIKGRSNIAAYSNWLGIVYGQPATSSGKSQRYTSPAACVRHAHKKATRVNVAGYDMDNAKARQWCEHSFPVYSVQWDEAGYAEAIQKMIIAADSVRGNVIGALKEALKHDAGKKQAGADKSLFEQAGDDFWAATESEFYERAESLAQLTDENQREQKQQYHHEWGQTLLHHAKILFDTYVGSFRIPVERIGRMIDARDRLIGFTVGALRKADMFPPKEEK